MSAFSNVTSQPDVTIVHYASPSNLFNTRPLTVSAQLTINSNYPSVGDANGNIHAAVDSIAKILFGDVSPAADAPLSVWNTFLQAKFLRAAGSDHCNIQNLPQHDSHDELVPHFEALGLVHETLPTAQKFDQLVVFGGTPWDTRERFSYVKELRNRGIATDAILYLNGDRKLQESERKWLIDQGYGEIEKQHEAAKAIWVKDFADQEDISLDLLTIAPPEGRRANTEDTLTAFFSSHQRGTVLFVTNGPYGPYQDATTRVVAAKQLTTPMFEVVSSMCAPRISTASLLDTIARLVYTIHTAPKPVELSQLVYLPDSHVMYLLR